MLYIHPKKAHELPDHCSDKYSKQKQKLRVNVVNVYSYKKRMWVMILMNMK